MSKGFTLMELVLTLIVLSVLSAFTFSVVWQYSKLYADTKGGVVYGEASAVLERLTRELRDAGDVYTPPFGTSNPATFVSFSLTHGTPAMGWVNGIAPGCPTSCASPPWVQYCAWSSGGRTYLYRVQNVASPYDNQCLSVRPTGANVSLMSSNIMSSGFQVRYLQGGTTSDNSSYEITLKLASDLDPKNPSRVPISLVTRVAPRNYAPYNPGSSWPVFPASGMGSDRSFSGGYYDEIN